MIIINNSQSDVLFIFDRSDVEYAYHKSVTRVITCMYMYICIWNGWSLTVRYRIALPVNFIPSCLPDCLSYQKIIFMHILYIRYCIKYSVIKLTCCFYCFRILPQHTCMLENILIWYFRPYEQLWYLQSFEVNTDFIHFHILLSSSVRTSVLLVFVHGTSHCKDICSL